MVVFVCLYYSAGCGRTGTLIGIDIARTQLLSKVRHVESESLTRLFVVCTCVCVFATWCVCVFVYHVACDWYGCTCRCEYLLMWSVIL